MRRAATAISSAGDRRVIEPAAPPVNLPDTVGYATPDELREFFAEIIARVPNSGRRHLQHSLPQRSRARRRQQPRGDPGRRAAGRVLDHGIGERAGNASLEELVMALRVRPDRLPYDTAIRSQALFETSQLLSTLTNEPVQANKAIVGRNAFAHEPDPTRTACSRMRAPTNHEARGRRPVGVVALVLAATPAATRCSRAARALGFTLTQVEVGEVYRAVISLGEHRKAIGDGDLRRIVDRGAHAGVRGGRREHRARRNRGLRPRGVTEKC